jgi:Tol biopolymer transport system component
MAVPPGTRVGPYEILAAIGAGGMGEVYRARDRKLDRDVAIKILPDALAADPERIARFEREAKTLAALNHPNIAHIHGLEESDGVRALVMELVEGPTLADRIEQGPIPIEEVLPIAKQIAEALEAAHEQGIIHRDLKPANIKVRSDGTVKVLDFGLAKALEPVVAVAGDVTASPTITTPAMTQMGMILGTAAYMSPEQAKGRPADKRSDIWAFGCVLYEMLTGKRAFGGEDVSDTLAAVLRGDPDWHFLPADTPLTVRTTLRRCLEKNPQRRLRDIADVRLEIEEALAPPVIAVSGAGVPAAAAPAPLSAPPTTRREQLAWALVAVFAIASIGGLVLGTKGAFSRAPAAAQTYRSSILLPEGVTFAGIVGPSYRVALSPDGTRLALSARSSDGQVRLWVRPLDALTAQPLAGTEGAVAPFWSPDGRSVGFFAPAYNGQLKKIDTAGGPVITLCDFTGLGVGATWNRDDVVLFTTTVGNLARNQPIRRVSASGGAAVAVTMPDGKSGENEHWWPYFLPDGKHFLYVAGGFQLQPLGIYVGSLDSSERRLLVQNASYAKYAQGYLTFLRGDTLMAQAFDARRLEVRGEAVPIVEHVETLGITSSPGAYSLSDTGILAYQPGAGGGGAFQLVWLDRNGKQIAVLGDQADYDDVQLSPDGARAVVSVLDPARKTRDLWIYDVARNLRTRFTFDPADDLSPAWAPEGGRLIFSSNRKGTFDLYQKLASGAGDDEAVLTDSSAKFPTSWSADGRYILYESRPDVKAANNVFILPLAGDRKPLLYLRTPFEEQNSTFSPDGRWIAYDSNESGPYEVYVAPFMGPDRAPGGKWQVSTSGGRFPRWRRDGKEIFYQSPDNKLMVAQVSGQGSGFEMATVRPLFVTLTRLSRRGAYDVSADGQRFLVATRGQQTEVTPPQVTLVVNWTAGLKK